MNEIINKHLALEHHRRSCAFIWQVLLIALWLTFANIAHADVLIGKVIGVSDGDTITVLDNNKQSHTVRLVGIDAPEKSQAFGQAAKKSLSDLVFGKQVEVLWEKRDRYQRMLGKVMLHGQDICLEQIKRGMAWHYKQYQRDQSPQDLADYAAAEQSARQDKTGLWADATPMEPAEFRRGDRTKDR